MLTYLLLLHHWGCDPAGEVETLAETWMLMEYCDRWACTHLHMAESVQHER